MKFELSVNQKPVQDNEPSVSLTEVHVNKLHQLRKKLKCINRSTNRFPYLGKLIDMLVQSGTTKPDHLTKLLKVLIKDWKHNKTQGKPSSTKLLSAVLSSHLSSLEEPVNNNSLRKDVYSSLEELLFIACTQSRCGLLQELRDLPTDINVVDQCTGISCLMIAVEQNDEQMVKCLLEAGANPKQADYCMGNTALHYSARYGHISLTSLLVASCEKTIHMKNKYGFTPLLWAAEHSQEDQVLELSKNKLTSHIDRIHAMELLATKIAADKFFFNTCKVYHYMEVSLRERTKLNMPKGTIKPMETYAYCEEICSEGELSAIKGRRDDIRIQMLIWRERLLGPDNPYLTIGLTNVAEGFYDQQCYTAAIRLWDRAAQLKARLKQPIYGLMQKLCHALCLMTAKDCFVDPQCVKSTIMHVYRELAMLQNQDPFDEVLFKAYQRITLHLAGVAIYACPSYPEQLDTFKWIYRMKELTDAKGHTDLLRMAVSSNIEGACFPKSKFVCFPNYRIVEVLIQIGFSAKSQDEHGNSLLHTIAHCHASSYNFIDMVKIISLLKESGCPKGIQNKKGETPYDLCLNTAIKTLLE